MFFVLQRDVALVSVSVQATSQTQNSSTQTVDKDNINMINEDETTDLKKTADLHQ